MQIIDGSHIECSHCADVISLDDAVLLENDTRALEKPLCSDCLGAIGVPNGYTLRRDISFLKR